MAGDRAYRLERSLREERPESAGILSLPALELHEERRGQDELNAAVDLPRVDDAPRDERLKPSR
jgi:hypothetical protein